MGLANWSGSALNWSDRALRPANSDSSTPTHIEEAYKDLTKNLAGLFIRIWVVHKDFFGFFGFKFGRVLAVWGLFWPQVCPEN